MISAAGEESNLTNIELFVKKLYEPESIAKFVEGAGVVMAVAFDSSVPLSNPLLAQANSEEFRNSVSFVGPTNIPAEVVDNLQAAAGIAWTRASAEEILAAMDAVFE